MPFTYYILRRSAAIAFALWVLPSMLRAQDPKIALFSDTSLTTFHLQLTTITQWHGPCPAKYSGQNSLDSNAESATSVTSTLFAGIRLWQGAGLYFNPELADGMGLSGVTGIEDR